MLVPGARRETLSEASEHFGFGRVGEIGADTDGALAMFREITVEVDGERMVLPAGGSAFSPRGTAHSFQHFSNTQAEFLVMVTPGGFHHFFEKLSPLQSQDPARLEQLAKEYGIEVLGPPLS